MNSTARRTLSLTTTGLRGHRASVRSNPAEVAAYTLTEAASIIGVPMSTLQKWTKGRTYTTKNGTLRTSAAIIATPEPRFLSFTNIVEAHMLASLRKRRIALEKIRCAVHYVDRHFDVAHALARKEFKTDGVDLFLDRLDGLVNASREGQRGIRAVLEEHLKRVEYDTTQVVRLFPLYREQAPRMIVVDPLRAFGRPVLNGTAVPIADIGSRFRRGDSIQQLARDYEVTPADIQEALRATRETAA